MMESLAYEIHEGKGPPVLLVHGLMGTRLAWGLNIDAFRKVASPVVVELWGHGRCPVPPGNSAYLVAEYVAQFEKIRCDIGVKTWLTIGVSNGGSLALQYALIHPEAVVGVAFTNDVSALGTEAERETMMARRNLLIPELSGPNGRAVLVDHSYNPRQPGIHDVVTDSLRVQMAEAYEASDPQACAKFLEITIPDLVMRDRFAELCMPLLWIHGMRERRTLALAEWAPTQTSSLEVFSVASGHAVNIEASTLFNAAAAAFIRRHSGSRA